MKTRKYNNRKIKKKNRKLTKKYRKGRIRIGGNNIEEIDIRQILLTKPILDSIKEYNPDIDITEFKLSKGEQGFKLTRMGRMMDSDFDKLLDKEPIELKVARTSNGKIIGTKIDGIMKKMYEIINGRHRITRAVINGYKYINANIIE
jgi:hypothetical protein